MWKKIGLGLFCLLILFAGVAILLLNRQISKAEAEFSELLQHQGMQVDLIETTFLPKPALHLRDLRFAPTKERSVSFKNIQAQFDGLTLLMGRLKIATLEFNEGVIADSDWRIEKISLKPTALYTDSIGDLIRFLAAKTMEEEASDKWSFDLISANVRNAAGDSFNLTADGSIATDGLHGNLKLSVQLAEAAYNQNKTFELEMLKFRFGKQHSLAKYEMIADSVSINNTGLGSVRAEFYVPSAQDDSYRLALYPSACRDCTASLAWQQQIGKKNQVQFRTMRFPLQSLLKILKLPVFGEGESEVEAKLLFERLIPQQGKFALNVADGKLRGLNILQLVGQYLPINYDESTLPDTNFEQFSAVYDWNKTRLLIEKTALRSKDLYITGSGRVNTDDMQCDIRLNIGMSNPKYRELSLPMHFFDNCYSPQYKIEVNKNFREQLKDYIKQRIKE